MKSFNKYICDPTAIIFMTIGIVLMAVALHFNLNPVCAGAIHGEIQEYPICLTILEILSIPAMFTGMILSSPMVFGREFSSYLIDSGLIYAIVYAIQILIYFIVGKIISLVIHAVRQAKHP